MNLLYLFITFHNEKSSEFQAFELLNTKLKLIINHNKVVETYSFKAIYILVENSFFYNGHIYI